MQQNLTTKIKMQQKHILLENLKNKYAQCTACPLGKLGRTSIVFGRGNPEASLVLIGEGPGAEEDRQGKPFVGASGKLLMHALSAVGITESDIYITNIVKCRPPENRQPTPQESTTCTSLLLWKQLEIIQPKLIGLFGATALTYTIGNATPISRIRGTLKNHGGYSFIPTYHPAYILRNRSALLHFTQDLEKMAQFLSSIKSLT